MDVPTSQITSYIKCQSIYQNLIMGQVSPIGYQFV